MSTASTIRLYAVPTVNSQRVAIALHELDLPYDLTLLDRAKNEPAGDAFRRVNPAGMAPVLVDGGATIAQSGAILVYLAERSARLLPVGGLARAKTFEWLMHVMSDVQATSSVLFFAGHKVDMPHAPTVALFEQRLATFIRHCEDALANSEYLAGEFSIADIALYPVVAQRAALVEQHGLRRLQAWAARIAERPATALGMRLGAAN